MVKNMEIYQNKFLNWFIALELWFTMENYGTMEKKLWYYEKNYGTIPRILLKRDVTYS